MLLLKNNNIECLLAARRCGNSTCNWGAYLIAIYHTVCDRRRYRSLSTASVHNLAGVDVGAPVSKYRNL